MNYPDDRHLEKMNVKIVLQITMVSNPENFVWNYQQMDGVCFLGEVTCR